MKNLVISMTIGAIALGSTVGVIGQQQPVQPTFESELGFVTYVGADATGGQIDVNLDGLSK